MAHNDVSIIDSQQVIPSVQLLNELSSWTRGQRMSFMAQYLVHEACQVLNSTYVSIEIKAMSGKLCDYRIAANFKVNELNEL